MNNETKEKIIEFNKKFGLKTEFIKDGDVLGYSLNRTIYINENLEHDYERTNKHELLHFFEETEEFDNLKKQILELHKDKLDEIRREYEMRYFGLYSEEEIKAGILDTEIAIDLLVDNSIIEYENGLKIGDEFLGNVQHNLEEKRYLNLTLTNNIKNMNLSTWEKIFAVNYYDGKEYKFPSKDKKETILQYIKDYLNKLYEMQEEDFKIDEHSPEIIRKCDSKIKAFKTRGEDTSSIEENREREYQELSEEFSKQLYEEYKHIVDFIKTAPYEDSFKALMLRETLTKIYKIDKDEEKNKTIIKKRELNKSIAGHMVLNETTLDFIYKNIGDMENYQNFAKLYFAAVEVFNKTIAKESGIKLEGVDTFGKGKWLKFEGKKSNENEYLKSTEKLSALVQDTQWCTKEYAADHLSEGDFFVFVDNDEKPHIAVKMKGDEIDEVRGLQNGYYQELEEDYRDVAISFLENNKEIKNGKEWLEKEKWNKRLIEYRKKIDEGRFAKEDVAQFMEDFFRDDYKSHGGKNTNKLELKNRLEKIKDKLAEFYECSENEICCGNIYFEYTEFKTCPYKVIFGSAKFTGSHVTNLGQLQSIGENADFSHSQIRELGQLQKIGGRADFSYSEIINLGQLQSIGGDVYFRGSQITDLGQLQSIGGYANFSYSEIINLGQLQSIGGDVYFRGSQITDLGQLQSIGGYANFSYSEIINLGQLQSIGGDVYFRGSQITDLGQLQSIGGYANFRVSKITDLGQLQSIGENADFEDSQITNLGQLQSIGGEVDFGDNIHLKELWEKRKEEIAKRKLTGQDIGQIGFGANQKECAEAKDVVTTAIEETKEGVVNKI